MPLYDVKCGDCGRMDTIFRTVERRECLPDCHCGGAVFRVLSAPMLAPTFEPYISPVSEKLITSRDAQRDDLRRHGKILYEPGMKDDIARNREREKEKDFAPIEATVDEIVRSAVSSGKLET